MGCNCGSKGGNPPESYVVRRGDGSTAEFTSKVAADIEATKSNGKIEVKKK